MMRLLIAIIIALFVSVGVALILREDPEYTLISIGQWTIETSVAFFVFFLLTAFILFYILARFLIRVLQAPGQARVAGQRYRLRKSQRFLNKGLRQLLEGRWKTAEISLMKGVGASRTPVLHYIGAAQAARRLNAQWRCNGYLLKAADLPEHETLPVRLTQAEFLLEDEKPTEARDILLELLKEHPRQPRALALLAQSYQQLNDWQSLQKLLSDLGKSAMLDETRYEQLQRQVYSALLNDTSHHGTLEELQALWGKIPDSLRSEESLIIEYAGHLRDHNAASEAEALLRQSLNRQWNDKLVVGYGEIGRGNITEQLATAEGWLKERGGNPHLLLTCGRLAKRARQPDKARAYLEQSIKSLATPDAYQELGEILEEMGHKEGALQCYRTGLRLLSGRLEETEGGAVLPVARTDKALEPVLSKDAGEGALVKGTKPPVSPQRAEEPQVEEPQVEEQAFTNKPQSASS